MKQVRIATPRGGGSSTSGVGFGCPCVCLDNGDIVVNGIATTSIWSVSMSREVFKGLYGNIIFPNGSYQVVYSEVDGIWSLDIGDSLTSMYHDESDATADTTMDGTLSMGFDSYGVPYVSLCVDGAVPNPV